ncbi:MAG: signal peptidase II [Roseburia sp.]
MSKIKTCILGLISSIILIFVDQWTKYMAVLHLKDQPSFVLWDGVFELRYLENHGAAFGMLNGQKWFLVAITILFLLALCYFYQRIPSGKKYWSLRIIAIFLFAGSVGNLLDRIIHNYVIDFFYFKWIDFPIFNVADIYVTVFCALLILLILFYYKEEDLAPILPKKHSLRKSETESKAGTEKNNSRILDQKEESKDKNA